MRYKKGIFMYELSINEVDLVNGGLSNMERKALVWGGRLAIAGGVIGVAAFAIGFGAYYAFSD